MNRARICPRRWLLVLAALAAPLAAAQGAPPEVVGDLPVTRVVLFTTGVGYFEHGGTVTGTQELELRVASEHMDDLLQSLVLEDLDGGTVQAVRYGARDPLARVLGSYALDLSNDPTLAELLAQARGEALRVEASETIAGVLVNVERTLAAEGVPTTLLTLATPDGLRRVALEEVRDLRFENAALRAELDAALAAIARARDADAHVVRLRFEGTGERRVRVGYVREMPVWKPTYRLVLGEDGRALLQGWAIFDNPTNLDLVDVQLAFVAGQPVSFVSSLFEPVYVARPRLDLATKASVLPPVDEGAFAAPERAAGLMLAPAPAPMTEAADRIAGAGVQAMAEGVATGASFAYRVREPVTVGRFESVLVPVLVTAVDAPRAAFFDGSLGTSPLQAVRLVNDTDLHLAAGPVTVFDAGGFAGTALLADLPPGDERWLSFAVDLDTDVVLETSAQPEQRTSVALRGALVETLHRLRVTTTVRIDVGGDGGFLVVEVPRRGGYDVVAPDLAPIETADALRFGVAIVDPDGVAPSDAAVPTHATCTVGGACRFEIAFERVERRSVALANLASDLLLVYLDDPSLSDADAAAIDAFLVLQLERLALDRDATEAQARLNAVFRDQERVRQNMAALDRNSSLYRRYLADLEAQENEVDALEARLQALTAERRSVQEQIEALVSGLADGD